MALLVSFLVIESRIEDPLLPLGIFRLRTLAGANVAAPFLGGSFFAFVFTGTLYMQSVLHYRALQTGLAWLSASVTRQMVMRPLSLSGSFPRVRWVGSSLAGSQPRFIG